MTPRLSPDELTIYFSGYAVAGDANLYVAHWNARTDMFDAPSLISNLNTSSNEFDPTVSPNALSIWFGSNRVVSQGDHLYVAIRASTLTQFDALALAAINAADTSLSDGQPFLTADGQEVWFTSNRAGATAFDIWHAPRVSDGFGTPVEAFELASSANDQLPTLSVDRLTIYFTSDRTAAGTRGGLDIWTSHRSAVEDGFPAPHLVDELNTAGNDLPGWLSADNCRLYGATIGPGGGLFMATRRP